MRLYLSSFRVGNRPDALLELVAGRRIGFIPNALDFADESRRETLNDSARAEVRGLGIDVIDLNLADYFGAASNLRTRLETVGGVWVRGGNVFVLRQAMRLSGFDQLVQGLVGSDFLYAGYSAGACVLAPSLDGLQHVDDPTLAPYPGCEPIFEGLGLLDYLILPHYKSDHPESDAIDEEVAYCERVGIKYRALRDGEVIVINDLARHRQDECGA